MSESSNRSMVNIQSNKISTEPEQLYFSELDGNKSTILGH